jgi:hypothetical protein
VIRFATQVCGPQAVNGLGNVRRNFRYGSGHRAAFFTREGEGMAGQVSRHAADWIDLTQTKDRWGAVVKTVMNVWVSSY